MAEPATDRLRVLLVEDSEDDALLMLHHLRDAGLIVESKRVQTSDALRVALREHWDLVISDFGLPGFSATEAYALLAETRQDVPFIIVSGTIGEDVAVRAMKAGVHDYLVKGNLARLAPAVQREVREARARAEQRSMREQLLISDRMASAGSLAAGVAHEINNPLAVAAANLELVEAIVQRMESPPPAATTSAELRSWLEGLLAEAAAPFRDADEAVARMREIVRDIKTFSRPQETALEPVDVRQVIESAIRMCWNEIRHRAKILRELDDVPRVMGNASRLGQMVLNLIINAAQAMPEGRADANEIRVVARSEAPGWLVLEVHDTGVGIAEADLERIFDPFFTTKPVGIGTGLGLSICRRIVADLEGRLSVRSEVGKGTTFRVALPATAAAAHPTPPAIVHHEPAPRSRVLVVDDELAVGLALKRNLKRHHDVTVVTSGRDALARAKSGERFDAILSDVMMPEMTGMELHRQMVACAPDQAARMIFMTGGAFTEGARQFLDSVSNAQLEKPFDVATLLAVVAEVVRSAAKAPDGARSDLPPGG